VIKDYKGRENLDPEEGVEAGNNGKAVAAIHLFCLQLGSIHVRIRTCTPSLVLIPYVQQADHMS
jgi:hypothetical protein